MHDTHYVLIVRILSRDRTYRVRPEFFGFSGSSYIFCAAVEWRIAHREVESYDRLITLSVHKYVPAYKAFGSIKSDAKIGPSVSTCKISIRCCRPLRFTFIWALLDRTFVDICPTHISIIHLLTRDACEQTCSDESPLWFKSTAEERINRRCSRTTRVGDTSIRGGGRKNTATTDNLHIYAPYNPVNFASTAGTNNILNPEDVV